MARYRVVFDGKWQGTFDDRNDAINWGQAVGETGRIVHVVKRSLLWGKLVAGFPESRAREAREIWAWRGGGGGGI